MSLFFSHHGNQTLDVFWPTPTYSASRARCQRRNSLLAQVMYTVED
jgi:hypothetical protein